MLLEIWIYRHTWASNVRH